MSNRKKIKPVDNKQDHKNGTVHHSAREEKRGVEVVRIIFVALIVLALIMLVVMSLNM
ncbi:MAG TPA: hypothetical protein PLK40_04280 [Bacteroidaceae bacterium]|nr:hypothetical protein [Bacteroidaceae bacterium]